MIVRMITFFILLSFSFAVNASSEVIGYVPEEVIEMANPKKKYQFKHQYSYEIVVTENGTTAEKISMDFLVPTQDNPEYVAMKMADQGMTGYVIFDHELESMVMLLEGNTGTVMSFDAIKQFAAMSGANAEVEKDGKIEKTGKTGSHLGFKYEELKVTSSDGKGTMWIGTDSAKNVFSLFMKMSGVGGNSPFSPEQFRDMDGLIIKADMESKENGHVLMTLVKSKGIDKTLDTSAYELMDFGSMMGN